MLSGYKIKVVVSMVFQALPPAEYILPMVNVMFFYSNIFGRVDGLKVESAQNPDLERAADMIMDAVRKRRAVLIVGRCWVDYLGRASSRLGRGERIIMIKEDGALLIHRPRGYEPVNWMPGGEVAYHVEAGPYQSSDRREASGCSMVLRIKSVRRRPRETLNIFFDEVYFVSVLNLTDHGEFSLYASEEDMQRAILAQPSLIEDGLRMISYEKKVDPGFVDVYGIDKEGRIVVIEIKRRTAGKEAALQLARYVESIKASTNRDVRGILVAPGIAKGVQRLLTVLGLDFKQLDPKRCVEVIKRSRGDDLLKYFR